MSATPEISWSSSRFSDDGLRTRFRPSRRIRPFYLTVAPWVDALVLIAWFCFAVRQVAIVPGIRAEFPTSAPELPAAPCVDGARSDLRIVVTSSVEEGGGSARVFFDETRYDLSQEGQLAQFCRELRKHLAALPGERRADVGAVLFVDKAVAFGDLAQLFVTLQTNDVPRILFATKAR